MKFNTLLLVVLAAMVLSCSKPGDTQTAVDTTKVVATTDGPTLKVATLTTEQEQRVQSELFFAFHNYWFDGGMPGSFPYKEEFAVKGNKFTYKLIRHNGDSALNWNSDDQADGVTDWLNVMDTISAEGTYIVYEDGPVESGLKKVRVATSGNFDFVNYGERTHYGERRPTEQELGLPDAFVDLGSPFTVEREDLWVKAKVTDITEADLAGMSKDELSYLRNEIFARHGHTFKTEKMSKYFDVMVWYVPVVDDASILFTSFEKKNVDFIKKREG
jgi:hypothetical protein